MSTLTSLGEPRPKTRSRTRAAERQEQAPTPSRASQAPADDAVLPFGPSGLSKRRRIDPAQPAAPKQPVKSKARANTAKHAVVPTTLPASPGSASRSVLQ